MAIWDVTQTTTYVTGNPIRPQQVVYLGAHDDVAKPPNNVMLDFFGVEERNNVQFGTPETGIVTATIQYSCQNPTPRGWESDRQVTYDYVVEFRAVRR